MLWTGNGASRGAGGTVPPQRETTPPPQPWWGTCPTSWGMGVEARAFFSKNCSQGYSDGQGAGLQPRDFLEGPYRCVRHSNCAGFHKNLGNPPLKETFVTLCNTLKSRVLIQQVLVWSITKPQGRTCKEVICFFFFYTRDFLQHRRHPTQQAPKREEVGTPALPQRSLRGFQLCVPSPSACAMPSGSLLSSEAVLPLPRK